MKIFAIGVALIVAVLAFNPIVHYTTLDTVRNVRILDKERVTESATDSVVTSKYLIFAQGETFENIDTIWAMKYNSSDIYGYIQKDLSCTFEVTGFRIPFFSMYRNILSAKCEFPAV
jgi:hypothetical protein